MPYYSADTNYGTSTYFNNYGASNEQALLESLIIESIKIYGQDMLYIPREIVSKDDLYTEDDQSRYTNAIPIELYIKSVDGFDGDGVFMSKFGLEIRDQVTFTVANRIFNENVGSVTNQPRPNEGDVIYFPLNDKLFQVKYVNYKPFFFQLGALQTYDLVCELFEYSGEVFDTGYVKIDEIQSKFSTNIFDYALYTEEGEILVDEMDDYYVVDEKFYISDIDFGADNQIIDYESEFGTETDQTYTGNNDVNILDWTTYDPFVERKS